MIILHQQHALIGHQYTLAERDGQRGAASYGFANRALLSSSLEQSSYREESLSCNHSMQLPLLGRVHLFCSENRTDLSSISGGGQKQMFQLFLSVHSHPALFALSCIIGSHCSRMRTLCLTLVIQELPYQGELRGIHPNIGQRSSGRDDCRVYRGSRKREVRKQQQNAKKLMNTSIYRTRRPWSARNLRRGCSPNSTG